MGACSVRLETSLASLSCYVGSGYVRDRATKRLIALLCMERELLLKVTALVSSNLPGANNGLRKTSSSLLKKT
jgi:hypothetical protein